VVDQEPILFAPAPDNNPALVARVVRGHNLGLIRDGWLVYYYDLSTLPATVDDDALYVARTVDGRNVIRRLKLGRIPGTFDLFTATGPVELDVELQWAQAIVWIKPHRLTDDQWAQLGVVT
jgi:hypothetical protein